MNPKPTIQIGLTAEQRAKVQRETGQEIHTLKPEPLEVRLAPGISVN